MLYYKTMRRVILIRHAQSTANITDTPDSMTAGELAFLDRAAGLTELGEEQCRLLAPRLLGEYGIEPPTTLAAVSTYQRPKLTAKLLGFLVNPEPYSQLDEVAHGMSTRGIRERIRAGQIPDIAVEAGITALEQAPKEEVWITHGLLIAGICIALGIVDQFERPVPRQCEVRRIEF